MCAAVGPAVGVRSLQLSTEQPWMVMGLGRCRQSCGLSGSGVDGPRQDTVRDWIP